MTTAALHIATPRRRGRAILIMTPLEQRFNQAIIDLKRGHAPMTKTSMIYAIGCETSGKRSLHVTRLLDIAVADGRLKKVAFKGRDAWMKTQVVS